MAFSSPPTTPNRSLQPSVRRAFTAPLNLSRRDARSHDGQEQESETLFAHDSAKIIAFTATDASGRPLPTIFNSSKGEIEEPVGVLPWGSWTERTVAAGPLRIYRVMNSVAFLNSGHVVQPMLAKSQCWCVDGVSKFAMRIRGMNYYRIELPCITTDEQKQVDLLKAVLDKLLQYEKTPCPFKRSFTVELPEPPETPVKKVPWRPKTNHRVSSADQTSTFSPLEKRGGNKDMHQDDKTENAVEQSSGADSPPKKVADFPDEQSEVGSPRAIEPENLEYENVDSDRLGTRKFSEIKRRLESPLNANRMDPFDHQEIPSLARTSSTQAGQEPNKLNCKDPEAISIRTESDQSSPKSFYSTLSIDDARTLSFASKLDSSTSDDPGPSESDPFDVSSRPVSSRSWDLSDSTSLAIVGRAGSLPNTRTIGPSIETCKPGLRVRREWEKRRMISPMPSSSNLSSPYTPSPRHCHDITSTLLERTCFYLIKPPLYLLTLMIKVAMQITRGSLQGSISSTGEHGQKIPCSWDFSSDDGDDSWDEDDYGVRLGRTSSAKENPSIPSGTWEID